MTFRRTASALHSIHLFFKVDLVVYCEGGPSVQYREAIRSADGETTADAQYWRSILEYMGINKTFHVKSAGSRTTICEIAHDVDRLGLKNISVCRDSDYEVVSNSAKRYARMSWTMGYSWENDVLNYAVLDRVVVKYVGVGRAAVELLSKLKNDINRFKSELAYFTEIDINFKCGGIKCIFDREKTLSSLDVNNSLRLNVERLKKRLRDAGYNRKPRRLYSVDKSNVLSVCYGKLVARAIYGAFKKLSNSLCGHAMPYEAFMRFAVIEAVELVRQGLLPEFAAHIEQQKQAFL